MNSDSFDTLVIGQYQQEPKPLDIAGSLKQLAAQLEQAKHWGVQLLITPEMAMTGYNISANEIDEIAEKPDGELFNAVANLCQMHSIAVVYGYAERGENNEIYNSVQLIDHTGASILNYRKTHLWGDLDRNLFSSGDVLSPVVSLYGWKIAAAICYDLEFPETIRHLTIRGAELVVVPTGLMAPYSEVAQQVVPVRAYENRIFIAYTNYCGAERDLNYVGCSSIVDPNGLVLASAASDPILLTATLNRSVLKTAKDALPYLTERRPELYGALT